MISKLMAGLIAMVIFGFSGAAVVHAQKPSDAVESAQSDSAPGIQTDVIEVRRMSDNTIRVRWRWRNTTEKNVTLNDGFEHDSTYLLDPVNKKKHFLVRDAKGNVIGSSDSFFSSVTIEANKAVMMWARFPAPPPAVNKITVVINGTPPFEDVAISK
jgi:hypothetical protein